MVGWLVGRSVPHQLIPSCPRGTASWSPPRSLASLIYQSFIHLFIHLFIHSVIQRSLFLINSFIDQCYPVITFWSLVEDASIGLLALVSFIADNVFDNKLLVNGRGGWVVRLSTSFSILDSKIYFYFYSYSSSSSSSFF